MNNQQYLFNQIGKYMEQAETHTHVAGGLDVQFQTKTECTDSNLNTQGNEDNNWTHLEKLGNN